MQLAVSTLVSFCAGLVLIAIATKMISESFQYIARRPLLFVLGQVKSTPILNYIFGGLISSFIHSGYSASVMFLSYLNSGLVNRKQALYLTLGSSIGVFWIFILLGFDYGLLDYYFIILGFIPMAYGRFLALEAIGRLTFSFGLLLLGYRLVHQILPLEPFMSNLQHYLSPAMVIGVSYLLFFVVQSQIVMLVVNLIMYKLGLLSVPYLIMFIFGSLLAEKVMLFKISLSSNKEAKRLSLFLFFISLLVPLFYLVLAGHINAVTVSLEQLLKQYLPNYLSSVLLIILVYKVLIHFSFLLSIILEKPALAVIEKYVFKTTQKEPQNLKFIGSLYQLSPVLSLYQVLKESFKMAATLQNLLSITKLYIDEEDEDLIQKIKKYERVLDNVQKEVFDYLSKVMVGHLNLSQGKQVRSLARIADEFESASDCCKAIGLSMNEINKMGTQLDGGVKEQLLKLFDLFLVYYDEFFTLFTSNLGDHQDLRKYSEEFDNALVHLKKDYLTWLKTESGSDYNLEASVKVEDIIRAVKQLKGHCTNILEAYSQAF
ncbi:MAG: Na/Pi cotransporter family protein [Bdellovibrionaceae bacterium]|jgi:phosphate:Na+ symporter|nr:Na/Pi cotransporter family protein [Pseudobdellovibrionaceae bacterium]